MGGLIKVVTDPLGLAGFALFLVFVFMRNRRGMPTWWPATAASLAGLCLMGGLILAFLRIEPQPVKVTAAKPSPDVSGSASAAGNCSPAFAGVSVGGSMSNTFNCTPSAASAASTAESGASEAKK